MSEPNRRPDGDVFIVSAARTPTGRLGGALSATPATTLGATAIRAAGRVASLQLHHAGIRASRRHVPEPVGPSAHGETNARALATDQVHQLVQELDRVFYFPSFELVMDVLSQMFEHAQMWFEKDLVGFSAMKDYVLFAVPKLLSFAETRSM